MVLAINPQNPQDRLINQVVEKLKQGGVIAYPTDTTYGIGCDIFNKKGVKNIFQIKKRDLRKPFSFICADLSDVSNYAQVSNFAFKIMKRHLPGPYTFVLEATRIVPDSLVTKQKTVGIRIPENPIALSIVRALGHPLVTTSANISGEDVYHDPLDIEEHLGRMLDLVIDGGILRGDPSTVISLIGDRVEVLREGAGDLSWIHQL
ncbi:L-threonylcarbamoyladenylate synthase [Geoalkalibacter halelectricus]|uniref:Threonylcarbamoyl-AMP synthase n=1 Tax=Geoalkalibacter halelectricus TaxID=2847045 RepID=A0ABY5ZQG9_9BACT|nr:L-threonylcarbamoyladenylate synthase [Geoalkalibacter halelectricus]MDO3376675.1 L-threonylcarbamoyladenylate synthase [Geoalkalibacter halelectricus]UWZ81373.1 threonylcarbamoyl-AMP synthase [Geoalkalibacter halelectricus]